VSILLCTRNRCDDLRPTLQSLSAALGSLEVQTEVVVIDNGSTDSTPQVVAEEFPTGRCVYEPKPGLSNARNRAVLESTGEVLVFVDDDIRVDSAWLPNLLRPFSSGADAVAGSVQIHPDLLRPWMTDRHRVMFAETVAQPPAAKVFLTGANMAFRRQVLLSVPAFDPELGAGAMGFCEETLFSEQLMQAGLFIVRAEDSLVVHCFQENRLGHGSMTKAAFNQGRSLAYMRYHWSHDEEEIPLGSRLRMAAKQGLEKLSGGSKEGATVQELDRSVSLGFHQQLQVEKKRPRNYEKRGLRKISAH
jgi:GT2 family glycosyltransferase